MYCFAGTKTATSGLICCCRSYRDIGTKERLLVQNSCLSTWKQDFGVNVSPVYDLRLNIESEIWNCGYNTHSSLSSALIFVGKAGYKSWLVMVIYLLWVFFVYQASSGTWVFNHSGIPHMPLLMHWSRGRTNILVDAIVDVKFKIIYFNVLLLFFLATCCSQFVWTCAHSGQRAILCLYYF